MYYTCVAVEILDGSVEGLVVVQEGNRDGLGQLASVKTNTCGGKAGEICRTSQWLCWPLALSGVKFVFVCKAGVLAMNASAVCLLIITSAFIPISGQYEV